MIPTLSSSCVSPNNISTFSLISLFVFLFLYKIVPHGGQLFYLLLWESKLSGSSTLQQGSLGIRVCCLWTVSANGRVTPLQFQSTDRPYRQSTYPHVFRRWEETLEPGGKPLHTWKEHAKLMHATWAYNWTVRKKLVVLGAGGCPIQQTFRK